MRSVPRRMGCRCFFSVEQRRGVCCTNDGPGMGVYMWIPLIVKCHEVGLELECDKGGDGILEQVAAITLSLLSLQYALPIILPLQ